MKQLSLTQADDWHLHLRDGDVIKDIVAHTAERFGRAIVMPNLKPPVTTTEQTLAYRQRILEALPAGSEFQPLMTLYLTDNTPVAEIARARESGHIHALKYYPAGATTNSDSGVTDMARVMPVLQAMAEQGMPLCIHGEVTDPSVDVFDREAVFIERQLKPLMDKLPDLKVVLEHITTSDAVAFIEGAGDNVAATITAHHLLANRNAMFQGGIRPHNYCLPVLKRESHRQALLQAATSGSAKYFLGTDSAPHPRHAKESACGCAGIYTAHAAIELYAEAFDSVDALDRLEGFASFFGADFYNLPHNTRQVTLEQRPWTAPASLRLGQEDLIPFRAGETIQWTLKAN